MRCVSVAGMKRMLRTLLLLACFGAAGVTLAFYVVNCGDELADDRLRLSADPPPPPEDFGPRYSRWLTRIVSRLAER